MMLRARITPNAQTKAALGVIGTLFDSGNAIEIRAGNVNRTADRCAVNYSDYFNFQTSLTINKGIELLDGRAERIYLVLNRFDPAPLARASKRLQAMPGRTIADNNRRWWLYLDADGANHREAL